MQSHKKIEEVLLIDGDSTCSADSTTPEGARPEEHASELPTLDSSEVPRVAKDLVQPLIMLANSQRLCETDLELYRHGTFQSFIQLWSLIYFLTILPLGFLQQ